MLVFAMTTPIDKSEVAESDDVVVVEFVVSDATIALYDSFFTGGRIVTGEAFEAVAFDSNELEDGTTRIFLVFES